MNEKPILFSGAMVRAILDGRKHQTRRVMKRNTPKFEGELLRWYPGGEKEGFCYTGPANQSRIEVPSGWAASWCPYGQPGDRLWVKETHKLWDHSINTMEIQYAVCPPDESRIAEGQTKPKNLHNRRLDGVKPWRPSIFMPRWASRITLEIVSVRVERLQDISEEDSAAEGMERTGGGRYWLGYEQRGGIRLPTDTAKAAFRTLWQSIHGPESWDSNPWVWVISFKKV